MVAHTVFLTSSCSNFADSFKDVLGTKGKLNLFMAEKRGMPRVHLIPPSVLEQFDMLLRQAHQAMCEGKETPTLQPMIWDALLILRQTGIRFNELVHLEATLQIGDHACLKQNAEGTWLCIGDVKLQRKRFIPIQEGSGVIEAIYRQGQRVTSTPTTSSGYTLFRNNKGQLTSIALKSALRKLAPHLLYEGQPYMISIHQFRHTIYQDAFEHDGIFGLTAFLGHAASAALHHLPISHTVEDDIRYDERLDGHQQGENLQEEISLNIDEDQQGENDMDK